MGRYVSGEGAGSQPRRKVITLTSSNPSIPVPEWARAKGALLLVSGCGAGSGGVRHDGFPTASAAQAIRHPIVIPAETESVTAIIGVGGNPDATTVAPNAGGDSVLLFNGVEALRLSGGSLTGGVPMQFSAPAGLYLMNSTGSGVVNPDTLANAVSNIVTIAGSHRTLFSGAVARFGSYGSSQGSIRSTSDLGAPSIFGANGHGYGYGGSSSPVAKQGGNGLLILEFVELAA